MKAIYTLALIAAGAALIDSAPLRASEVDSRIALSSNKSHADQPRLSCDAINIGEETSAQVNERAGFRFQDEVGGRMAPQVRPEAGAQPVTIYSSKIELRAAKPNMLRSSGKRVGDFESFLGSESNLNEQGGGL
jgi:hypothetical protein